MASRLLAVLIILALAGCGGGARQSPLLPAASNVRISPAFTSRTTGKLVLRVTLPRSGIVPKYVGPSTKGMIVDIKGPTNIKETVGLTVTAKGCKSKLMSLVCTLEVPGLTSCPSKQNCYTGTVTTYDAYKHGKIPHGAHALSEDVKFGFSIGSSAAVMPMVLYGIPKSVKLFPSNTSLLTGSQADGFTEPKCLASMQTVSVVAADADGNFIVGVGAPKIALSSDDPSQLAVSGGSKGVFKLTPPSLPGYPHGGHTIHLTAKAVAPAAAAHDTATSTISVSYTTTICGIVSEFDLPSSSAGPYGIVAGPDGALWFTEENASRIGRMTTSGAYTEFGTSMTPNARPIGITVGPDHNLWFAEYAVSKIGKMTTSGALTEYPTMSANAEPVVVAPGADGRMWYTELHANDVAASTLSGSMTEYAVPTAAAGLQAIAPGPGGTLWFAELSTDKIARVTTSGAFTEIALASGSSPIGVVDGPGGQVYFTESGSDKIGAIAPNGLGTPTIAAEHSLAETNTDPLIATVGPDGEVWFTEEQGNRVATINADGVIVEYGVPTSAAAPAFVTAGPDGSIWFTELAAGKIGRIR